MNGANRAATALPALALSANQMLVSAPAGADGPRNLVLTDPDTGSTSQMTAALTYGAGPNDTIHLLLGSAQQAPVGGTLPDPIIVQVIGADQVSVIAGASVVFSSSPAASLAACGGASTCTVLTDQSGRASTSVTVLSSAQAAPFPIIITAKLAPLRTALRSR